MGAAGAVVLRREQVLAHRVRAQELDRPRGEVAGSALAVSALGVADVPHPAAATALAVRGGQVDDALALVWGARGAPALHRRAELQALADALWPRSDADAARRLANPRIADGARLGLAAFRAVAAAVHEVLAAADGPVPKAELSRGVTERVPDALSYDCAPCGARHVAGSVLQAAGLAGGAELVRAGRANAFRLLPQLRVPEAAAGTDRLVRRHLHLLGPAAPADVAASLQVSVADVRAAWPADLAEFSVDGRRTWAPAEDAGSLTSAQPARLVRLLPPGDPWLQARDRALTVPAQRHRLVWRPIGAPGVLLVDGEVLGTWRAARTGARLDVGVEGWQELPARVRSALAEELPLLAAARGARSARLTPS